MTEFDLLRLIGEAEDQYVMNARRRPRSRGVRWKPLAAAACLLLVLLGGAGIWRLAPWQGQSAASSGAEAAVMQDASAAAGEEAAPAEAPAAEVPTAAKEYAAAAEETAETDGASSYDVTLLAEAAYPEAIGAEDYEASSQRWQENQVTDETRDAMNAFAYRTAAKVLKGGKESGCYSPLSLYQALAILASGAEGQTRDEILSLLGMTDKETLAEESGKLYRVNYSDNEADVLKIANSLWLDETGPDGAPVQYHQDWVLSAAADYYASVYAAEFGQEDTALALGQWIADNTGGMLRPAPETLGLDADTVMAIVNTLWYQTHWTESFAEEDNTTEDFTTEDGETVQAEYMHQTDDMGSYVRGADYTKASLSLTRGRMIVVLPDEGTAVDDLLSEERLWDVFESSDYQSAEVQWSVPKFTTDATYQLEELLQELGVQQAFGDDADFSDISDTALKLTKVQQGTHIAVNEDGVEAAAYTFMGMEAAGLPEEDPEIVKMDLNRPFIYLITANDGSALFLGVVRNPNA